MEALGGKSSLGTSPVIEAERAALSAYIERSKAIGPVNSNEKAKMERASTVLLYPRMAEVFRENGFDF